MKVIEITFSPTGGTKKVADTLAGKLSEEIKQIDLTDSAIDFSAVSILEDDICVIAVPSYGGRVPKTAIDRLSKINGNNAKAVLAVVYGNREFEDTLVELSDTCIEAGFVPMAAVSAIAEHSIVRKFAAGRPDKEDCAELEKFADEISKALKENKSAVHNLPGNRPYKESKGAAAKPVTDSVLCGGCGLCAAKCPVMAIDKANPAQTDTDICISCMRCISICPNQARKLDSTMLAAVEQKLEAVCSGRKLNKLY